MRSRGVLVHRPLVRVSDYSPSQSKPRRKPDNHSRTRPTITPSGHRRTLLVARCTAHAAVPAERPDKALAGRAQVREGRARVH